MPNISINPKIDYVTELSQRSGKKWPTIVAARADALAVQQLLRDELRRFTSEDVDLVAFGSLARREWTSGSDVDWTLLVDGQANSDHRMVSRTVEQALSRLKYKGTTIKPPGAEGVFGNMAFSHEIVHHIGGQADTNRNTTQRILLLLEAVSLSESEDEESGPFERIVY